jgi:DNA-binding response OmpR family regulator
MQMTGLTADSAATPTAALEKLGAQKCDLIFLDVGLPEMNGFDVCTRIRGIEAHEKTPIVFLTGMATFHNRAQASLSGGNDFVGKPFNLAELGIKAMMWIFRAQLSQL